MIVHPAVVIMEESVKINISASLVIVMEQDIQETDVKQVTTGTFGEDYYDVSKLMTMGSKDLLRYTTICSSKNKLQQKI